MAQRTAYVRPTFEKILGDTMDEIKAMAARAETYGDHWKLEEAIADQLATLRETIAEDRRDLRTQRAKRARFAALFGDHDWMAGYITYLERRIALATANRDELVEGRRELKRQDREHLADSHKFLKWYERERAAGRIGGAR